MEDESNKLNNKTQWKVLSPLNEDTKLVRSQHCSCNLPNKNAIAIFGGYGYSSNCRTPSRLNDLLILNTNTNKLEVIKPTSSTNPSPRVSASLCSLLDGILLFGGRGNPSSPMDDLWFFDINRSSWIPIYYDHDAPHPCPRWNSSIVSLSETHCALFGGRDSQSIYGDFWTLHLHYVSNRIEANWFCLYDTENTIYNANASPGCRFSSCLLPICSLTDNACIHDHILIIGGKTTTLVASSTIYLFKCSKRQWFTVPVCDADANLSYLVNSRCCILQSNDFLLVGTHCETLQPFCLELKYIDNKIYCYNKTKDLLPISSSFVKMDVSTSSTPSTPPPSIISSEEPLETIISGFTMAYQNETLYMLGGGGVFYWMPHFNQSLYCHLAIEKNVQSHCYLLEGTMKRKRNCTEEIHEKIDNQSDKQDIVVLVKESKKIKLVKTYLEKQSIYDKSRKITKVDKNTFGIPVKNTTDFAQCIENAPNEIKESIIINKANTITLDSNQSIKSQSENAIREFCKAKKWNESSLNFHKVETIGSLLVFNKLSITGQKSELFWEEMTQLPSIVNQTIREAISPIYATLFISLLSIYNCNRVGIHAEIDCGPKRQSHSRLVYSLTSDKDDGWITVRQNTVLYSWPFERVMFASGNNTERMRMGQIKAKDEFVIDLYAGIGYFTIPIAVKTGVKKVLCFEINEDSVNALKRNIEQNGVSKICEVILGDNRVMTKSYHDIADRVLLGLLPSSREGWPLAMQVLKKEGGMLHVHENIHDCEYDMFIKNLCSELETIGKQKGKEYHCSIQHIEKVKSYAPKVFHYVIDVFCQPI